MGFYQEYELLGLVHDGPTKTLRAREIASDRPVFLHLLTGALRPEAQRTLLECVETLRAQSSDVLRVGEFAGTRYVVTDVLDPFSNLEHWVNERIAGSPDGGAAKPPDAPVGARPEQRAETQPATSSAASPDATVTTDANQKPAGSDSGRFPAVPPPASSPLQAQPSLDASGPAAGSQTDPGEPETTKTGQIEFNTDPQPSLARPAHRDTDVGGPKTAVADGPTQNREAGKAPEPTPSNGHEAPVRSAGEVTPEQGLRELTDSLDASPADAATEAPRVDIQAHLDEARQHLGNDAVRNALDSLESALKLRPDHPEALALVDEAKQREHSQQAQEELQVQKEWHYQKAREAWEDGDLEATLEELERLSALEYEKPGETERSGIYREFQRQVHSENQAVENSYAEARALMAEENLEAALAICDRYLAKFPNHAQFQALRFDIGERRRQEALAFIADTDRAADAEPNLDRRIEILQQALAQAPGEKHFEEAIRLVREKQQLVRSVVDKAKALEQSLRFREALEQWQLVESIHPQLPGLQENIQRVGQRIQESRVQKEAHARWLAQSKRCLQAGDYEQALELVRNALVECPDDAELRQLELEAGEGLQRADSVRDYLRQAQHHWHAGQRPQGLECLRKAQELDPRNSLVRGELINALVEMAREQADTDWATAQPLIEEILRLEPNHTTAVHLLEQIGHQKREETVSWCLVEARRLRSTGDVEGAYRLVCEYLSQYPEEERLSQLQTALAQQIDPSLVEEASSFEGAVQGAEESGGLFGDAGETEEPSAYQDWAQDSETYSESGESEGLYESELSDQTEYQAGADYGAGLTDEGSEPYGVEETELASEESLFDEAETQPEVSQRPLPKLLQREPTTQDQEDLLSRLASENAITKSNAPRPKPDKPKKADAAGALASLKQKYAALAEQVRGRVAGKNFQAVGRSWPVLPTLLGVGAAFLLLAILSIVAISRLTDRPATAPSSAGLAVAIQSSPPGATLTVDGQTCPSPCQLELSAESHRVEAHLAGFRTAVVSFNVDENSAAQPFIVTLSPFTPGLHISSDLASGTVTLDGQALGELEDGGLEQELTALGDGEHTLRLASSGSTAEISFEVPAGEAPRLTAPPSVNSLKAVVIAGLGAVARVHGTEAGQSVSLDGQPQGKLGSEPLVLQNLAEGSHELTIGAGREQRRIVFDSGPAPLLAAFVNSDRNVGSLRVITGEDDVQIFLNGAPYRRKTARGRRLIYLYPNKIEVRVEKEGFRSPPPQMAEIRKGEEVRLEFEMTPLPRTSTLRLTNAVPGTEVFIDGQSRGVVRSGVFTLSSVEPGRHSVRLEHPEYKTAEFEREFEASAPVELDGTLESSVGTLEIQVVPANVNVRMTLQREGETTTQPISDRRLRLPAGTYTVQASASGFNDYAATVRVVTGQTKTATLTLTREEPKVIPPAVTLSDWEKNGWQRDGDLLVKRGGDFLIAENSGGAGRYTFTALLQRGRRLEWVVNYVDRDNYVFYQLGDDFLHRTEVSKGRKSRTVKIPHKMKWNEFLGVDIRVAAGSIVHRVLVGDQWVELDNWRSTGTDLTAGKFGFHISGRDQVGLSHFAFVPER